MTGRMRTIGGAVAALAVTVMVVGATVGGAAASPRDDAVAAANAEVDSCLRAGGDPSILMDSTGESITLICDYGDGNKYVCTFNPVTRCGHVWASSSDLTPLVPAGTLTQIAPSAPDAQPGVAAPDDHHKHAQSPTPKKHRHGGKGGK